MTIETGSEPASSPAGTAAATGSPGGPAQPGSRQRRMIIIGVELTELARYLASRRFARHAIIAGVGVAAVAGVARENQARSLARLSAWDKARALRQEAHDARRRKGK